MVSITRLHHHPEKQDKARTYMDDDKSPKNKSVKGGDNKGSVMIRDLNRCTIHQAKIISELMCKLVLIYNISNSNQGGNNNADGGTNNVGTIENKNTIDTNKKEIHLHMY